MTTPGRRPSVGVHPTATDLSMPVLELARATEARGLESIYFPEHTHVPLDSLDITANWRMSERYQRSLDPFVCSSFVAATTSLEVGSAISLVAQHDAIALAKEIATIDHLCGGRVVVGVGFGYNRQEAANHGVSFGDRAAVVEETVRLMRSLWTEDEASFDGRFRRLTPSWSWPKPVRPGGPPVLLGGRATERTFERVASWADGWIPMGQTPARDPGLGPHLDGLRGAWDKAGRAAEPQVLCFFPPGSADEMTRELELGARLGIQRMQVLLEDRTTDEVLPVLDDLATAVGRLGS
ncbi:TIGR03619 family F420-dependent LLM class oxidoreductase [Pseudofrankia inefficax]|uniref:Putative F420-dependent oxidoreductase n=1 Tax=Pseudofrankia inefficax (strain DSM 45817 / CECT 9037 / DDB 130130 / EuI1c) TaxID=298654 RepID=E3J7T6_PSEI1|nr:TIGR03619 family F420-dependent LLM class oxidoreductase [Pseudofrankia inefficax]ADP80840.1 putative F420-dependent oxidoreductase [Pseudofrankia inefficax]